MDFETDVLIIGSGIAGLFAALKTSEFANVIIVTKKDRSESNTNYAQGGIASVIDKNDSFESHIKDTLISGAGLCDPNAVRITVEEGPERIKDLIEIGTSFTRKNDQFDLANEGGHSMPRILHADDLTGRAVERALVNRINSLKNIHIIENALAIDLITEHNLHDKEKPNLNNRNCWGAYVLDCGTNTVFKIRSKAVILATGGLGQVYQHTTNPGIATGDGFAMAYRSEARIANMEFIQFHPTSLFLNGKNEFGHRSFLISEAVRGFGGILKTQDGTRFMEKYDERKELAPRDIVARAIDNELKKRGEEFVYLDITHKNKNDIVKHFPNIYETCLRFGINITSNLIPVVPSAHYACGGIMTDEFARTSLRGLYACGEVSMTGLHGANRLASNSLLEAVVYSNRAAIDIQNFLSDYSSKIPEIPDWDDSGTLSPDELILITHSVKELKQIMWDYVGIVRTNLRLERAARRVHNIYVELENLYKKTKVFEGIIELRNLAACAHMIIKSAKLRKESRGLHYNLDYPHLLKKAENTIIQNEHP